MVDSLTNLESDIIACRACAADFTATPTAHEPRPVVHLSTTARILVAGQAPGKRVYNTGLPFNDPSGDRLRNWMGIGRQTFYDQTRIAIAPMAFCFPGQNHQGHDLPPPPRCAWLWRRKLIQLMPQLELVLLIGSYAQKWHLAAAARNTLTETVRSWQDYQPGYIPLPHPSWRNNAWLKNNPWFAATLLPHLRKQVAHLLAVPT